MILLRQLEAALNYQQMKRAAETTEACVHTHPSKTA